MCRTLILTIFLDSILPLFTVAQDFKDSIPQDTLAIVDSWPITSVDLFERIALMPFVEKTGDHDFESVKRKAVESLVGERLLSMTYKDSDAPDKWHMDRVEFVLRKMLVRDLMYKRQIRDKAEIQAAEIEQRMNSYTFKRRLLMLRCTSTKEALDTGNRWRRLRHSVESNDKIFASLHQQPDTVLIAFGSVDTVLENAAYHLKDTLDISGPVDSKLFGTVVVQLYRVEPNAEAQGKTAQERERAVREILQQRRESVLAEHFVDQILRGKRMEADTGVFRSITRRLWETIRSDTVTRRVPKGYRYMQDDLYHLLQEFKTVLDTPLVRGSFGTLSVGEFLESLFHYDFSVPSLHPRSFAVSMFEIVRTITEADMIAQEGLREGYQNNAEVVNDESKWMDYWKSRYAKFVVVDSVGFPKWEPVWSLWRYHTAVVESACILNVQEVLRPDSSSAASIAKLIREGANVDSLARQRSIRKEWSERGGESGWFRFNAHREIASQCMMMNIGDIRGPLRLREGFSVVRLLGRKFEQDTSTIRALMEEEMKRVKTAHQQAAINRYVAHEALRHKVEIYYERIKKAEVSDMNMFTRRMIGFGGRMNAAPVLTPQWEWVREWERFRTVNQ